MQMDLPWEGQHLRPESVATMSHEAVGGMLEQALRFVRVQQEKIKLIWMGDGKEWPGLAVMLHHRECWGRNSNDYEEIEHGPGRWRVLKQGKHFSQETKDGLLRYLDRYKWENVRDKMIRSAITIIKNGKFDMCLASRRSLRDFYKDQRPDVEVDADTEKDEKVRYWMRVMKTCRSFTTIQRLRPQARPPMPGHDSLFPLEQAPAASIPADTNSGNSIMPKPTEPLSPHAIPTSKQSEEEEAPMNTSLNDEVLGLQARPSPCQGMSLFCLEQAHEATAVEDQTGTSSDTSMMTSPHAIPTSKQSEEEEAPMDISDNGKVVRPQARPPMPGRDSVSSRAGVRDDGW
jgi:hypothetical protein